MPSWHSSPSKSISSCTQISRSIKLKLDDLKFFRTSNSMKLEILAVLEDKHNKPVNQLKLKLEKL